MGALLARGLGCRGDDALDSGHKAIARALFFGGTPAIDKLKSLGGTPACAAERPYNSRVCPEEVGDQVREHDPHRKEFDFISVASGHLVCSLAAALRALEGSLPTAAYRLVLP